ncbi:MAG: glycosyltransferase [Bacteroidota bacterium]|nr:glycosyltransferase [Bacteroidota bacterium]
MTKNVLYLSYDGMTDPLGQSQVLPYIIGLSKKGYKFHLVSFEKPNRFKQNRKVIERICSENEIEWHPLMYTKRPPLLSTIWDVRKMKRKSYALHRKYNFSIVHCRSYLSSLIGNSMKIKFGISFLFDMRGFWADERVDGKLWDLKNPIYKWVYNYFKRRELQFLNNADYTVSLTFSGKEEMLKWEGVIGLKNRLEVIPCCADLNLFKPVEGDSKIFTLGYLGSIGTWYLLDEMLLFYKGILEREKSAVFHFLTKEEPNIILERAKELGVSCDKMIIEESSRSDIPYKTRNWSYSIFFILPSFSKKSSSPTKQGELMGMGIPVICNDGVGDVKEIVQKYKSGLIVDLNSTFDFDKVFSHEFEQTNIVNGARDYFSLQMGIKKYEMIYNQIN